MMDDRGEEVADIIDQCKLTAIRYEEQDIYLKCCNSRIERESATTPPPPPSRGGDRCLSVQVSMLLISCHQAGATNELQDAILAPSFDL